MNTRSALRIACVALSLTSCDAREPSEAPSVPVRVLVYEVTTADAAGETFTGSVQPQIKTDKVFTSPGKVTSVNVKAGDLVKAGDILATIDATALEWQAHAAQAQLNAAEAQLNNARVAAQRQSELVRQGVSSQAAAETANGELASALSNWDSARAKREKAETELGRVLVSTRN